MCVNWSCSAIGGDTPPPAPQALVIPAEADASIYAVAPAENFGLRPELETDADRRKDFLLRNSELVDPDTLDI